MYIKEFDLKINQSIITFPATDLAKDTIIGIFGASGSGKTTLLHHLYEIIKSTASVRYMKQDVILPADLTVLELLSFYEKMRCDNDTAEITEMITKLQMESLLDARIGSFEKKIISGGEKKRVMLTSVLLDHADIFLLDEPFSGLDITNIDIIFKLLMKKKKNACIIFTVHEFSSEFTSQLDAIWELIPAASVTYVRQYTSDKVWQQIELDEGSQPLTKKSKTNLMTQWKNLLYREYLMRKRNPVTTFAKFVIPVLTIVLQNLLIGFLSVLEKQWISHQDVMSFLKLILNFNIVVFTAGILPMAFLTDHFQQKLVVHHEISQGFYSQLLYVWTMMLLDHFILTTTACVVALLSMPTWVFFMNLTTIMLFTNVLMWFLSYVVSCSYPLVLLLLTTYISMSYLINFGFIMVFQNRFIGGLQYLSMMHIQTNIFLYSLPDLPIVQQTFQQLNILDESFHNEWSWTLLGFAYLGFLYILLLLKR